MKRNPIPQLVLAALLGTVALAGCKKDAPAVTPPVAAPAPMPPAPPPVAASVTSVDLGTAVGPDMRVTMPTTTFATKDTIHAAIATSTSDPLATMPGKLGVRWSHVDSSQVVHEESRDVNFTGNGVTDFQISKPDGWPVGKYKLEVMLDGAMVQSREFEVR